MESRRGVEFVTLEKINCLNLNKHMNDLIRVKSHKKESDDNSTDESLESAFRSYDVRGIYPEQLDAELAYKVAKAFLKLAPGERYLIAKDMRKSSSTLEAAIIQAFQEENKQADSLGQTTTDNLYFAVGSKGYDGGVMITASHNAAHFNGLKFVKKEAQPVVVTDLKEAYEEITEQEHYLPLGEVKPSNYLDTKAEFIKHALRFSEGTDVRDLKIVVDAGNGMAGTIVADLLANHPGIDLVPMYFEPHPDFPHHEANPAIPTNMLALTQKVKDTGANLGVAFDGDGDRVFFVDETGEIIKGYYIQALLTKYFLEMHKGETVIYDLRNTMAIEQTISELGGRGVESKAGHVFLKQKMRQEDAIFGGESTSSHFYFRDNYYADSGVITLEIILKLMCGQQQTISQLVAPYRDQFHTSGERNFYIKDKDRFPEIVARLKREFPEGSFSDFDGFVIDFSNWRFSIRPSATEPFVRLNIESKDKSLLEEKQAAIFNIVEEYAQYTGVVSNLYGLRTLNLDKSEKLEFLYSNMQFTWNSSKGNYLDDLYGSEWARNQTPLDVLRQVDPPVLDVFYEQHKYNIEESIRLQETYLNNETWFDGIAKHDKLLATLNSNPIVYFSLEYGFADWLQIYSGGLGVLAGDTIKEASDTGLPLVAVGLFYAEGYFHQRLDESGMQIEDYIHQDTDDYPLELIRDQNGYTIEIPVRIGDHDVYVRGWRLKVGRRSVILLDTDFASNENWEDRMITHHLYGGDEDTRIRQEIVLGIGGYRFVRATGITPSILHLNEGHSAFTVLAATQEFMSSKGINFQEALQLARNKTVFTNHTLKQAGNDIFPYQLVEKYLGPYASEFGVEFREIFSLGVDPVYAEGKFGMTIFGFNNSAEVNAVSKIHAEAAKKVWTDHPMKPVTNGVHMSTWVNEWIHELLDTYVGERWNEQGADIDWGKLRNIPDDYLWNAHQAAKKDLIVQMRENCKVEMPEDSLIFGWFRRVTKYKQPEIVTLDLDRLDRVLNHEEVNARFIFGGKAHPRDPEGKQLIQEAYQISQDPRFKDKLIFIPDYNWRMARYMVSGADVWVNSPVRFQEACGTSGMKAGANGLLQFSTIDGWIDEIADTGEVIKIEHHLDAQQFYSQIESEIIPLFTKRDDRGLPVDWLKRMKEMMIICLSFYGTDRMLRDYIETIYRPVLKSNLQY